MVEHCMGLLTHAIFPRLVNGQLVYDVIMSGTGREKPVPADARPGRERRHNENDVTMTITGLCLWRYGDWRHVATGCTALVFGRPFVKQFALCYQTVVCLSVCLSVCPVYRVCPVCL